MRFALFLIFIVLLSTGTTYSQKMPIAKGLYDYTIQIEGGTHVFFPYQENGTLNLTNITKRGFSIFYENLEKDHIILGIEKSCVDSLNSQLSQVPFQFTYLENSWAIKDSSHLFDQLDFIAKQISEALSCPSLQQEATPFLDNGLTHKEVIKIQHSSITTLADVFVNAQNFSTGKKDSTFNLGFMTPDSTPFIYPYTINKRLETKGDISNFYIEHQVDLKKWQDYYANEVKTNLISFGMKKDSETFKETLKQLNEFEPKLYETFNIQVKENVITFIKYEKEETLTVKGGEKTSIEFHKIE